MELNEAQKSAIQKDNLTERYAVPAKYDPDVAEIVTFPDSETPAGSQYVRVYTYYPDGNKTVEEHGLDSEGWNEVLP